MAKQGTSRQELIARTGVEPNRFAEIWPDPLMPGVPAPFQPNATLAESVRFVGRLTSSLPRETSSLQAGSNTPGQSTPPQPMPLQLV